MRNVNDFNDSHDNFDNDPRGLGGRPGPGFGGGRGHEHRGPGGFAPQGPGFGAHRGFDRMGGGGRRDRGFGPGGNGGFPDGFGADFAPGFGPDADPRGQQGHGPEREPGDDFPDDRFGGHFRGGRGEHRGPGRGQRPDFGGMGGFGPGFGPGFGGPMGGPRGGRGGRGPGRGRKGDVRNAILALLKDQPMNGYQLITAIGEKSEGLWNPSAGSVYPALGLLTDEGLIRETQVDGKKVSELTETGREYVEQHADELTAPWEKVAGPHQGFLDIRPEVGQLAMAVQQVVVQGEQSQIEAVRGILDRARKDIYRLLAGDADTTGGSDTTGTTGATEADAR